MPRNLHMPSISAGPALLTWVASRNDPERDGAPGPTLTLLFEPGSPYCDRVQDVVLLARVGTPGDVRSDRRVAERTRDAILARKPTTRVEIREWSHDDPTDHRAILGFLREQLPDLRRAFPERELVIHLSPGTGAMQTVWVVLSEGGFIEPPYRLVQSFRREDRRGDVVVAGLDLGLDTFLKGFRVAAPAQVASPEQAVRWDLSQFRSAAAKEVYAAARSVAGLKIPVLLLGERGTGKSSLAGWIRQTSPWRRPEKDPHWPAVACGQYAPETMRAELCGHTKGAFTGATAARPGLLDAADGDTLFLDEIGDMSRELQRLLIKTLDEGQFLPLGSLRPRASDFRLICATNVPEPVLRDRLDPDFYDRVATISLTMPPLRELGEDIPWLWDAVLHDAAVRAQVAPLALPTPDRARLLVALRDHSLPGNLRDLSQVAFRMLAARTASAAPDLVAAGLSALHASPPASQLSPARQAARAFASGTGLAATIPAGASFATEELFRELRRYLAGELRALAAARSVAVETLCDVHPRSLRDWLQPPGRKTSPRRKKTVVP